MPASSLISPALGRLADLALWETELAGDPVTAESALVSRLRQVPDRRAERGRRHPLVVILALVACATLVVGSDSMTARCLSSRVVAPDSVASAVPVYRRS